MTDEVFLRVALDNRLTQSLVRKDTAAVTVAAGGAMGTPGEVVVYFADSDNIVEAVGNYVYGGLDLDALWEHLHLDKRGTKAWTEFELGMGNTLFINARDYRKLDRILRQNPYPDFVGPIYRRRTWMSLSALHGIMDELRKEIEMEEEAASRLAAEPRPSKGYPDYDDPFWDDFCVNYPILVYLSTKETEQCAVPVGAELHLPDPKRIYLYEMDKTPDQLCVEKVGGWEKTIRVKKRDFPKVLSLWYPEGVGDWNWQDLLDRIEGDTVCIKGFGD